MYCNEKFIISQVGEALEEDLSSGGVRGTQLLAHQKSNFNKIEISTS